MIWSFEKVEYCVLVFLPLGEGRDGALKRKPE